MQEEPPYVMKPRNLRGLHVQVTCWYGKGKDDIRQVKGTIKGHIDFTPRLSYLVLHLDKGGLDILLCIDNILEIALLEDSIEFIPIKQPKKDNFEGVA